MVRYRSGQSSDEHLKSFLNSKHNHHHFSFLCFSTGSMRGVTRTASVRGCSRETWSNSRLTTALRDASGTVWTMDTSSQACSTAWWVVGARIIRRREKPFMYAKDQFSHTCPANIGKGSCGCGYTTYFVGCHLFIELWILSSIWLWSTYIWNFNFVQELGSPFF